MFGNSRDEIEAALTAAEKWNRSEDRDVAFKIRTLACLGPNELTRLRNAYANIPPNSAAGKAIAKLIQKAGQALNFGRDVKISY